MSLDYKSAGVDKEAGYDTVARIKQYAGATHNARVLGQIGAFGAFYDLSGYRHPILVSGTDGVGTKLKIAFALGQYDTIGIDAVAMCVNDILCHGAAPQYFLDYLACGKLEPAVAADIVKGVAEGCAQAGAALIGGETAEMPGFYQAGEYDIAGFAVGVVEKSKIITSERVQEGDVLLALPSSGVHSNGFSLVRKICFEHKGFTGAETFPELQKTLGEELLTPTRLYPRACLPLIEKFDIHGMVHITGGGFYENIPRALPEHLAAEVDASAWQTPPIFRLLQEWGNVDGHEMYRTFNMGVGMVIIAAPEEAAKIRAHLASAGEEVYEIGCVKKGAHDVTIKGGVLDA